MIKEDVKLFWNFNYQTLVVSKIEVVKLFHHHNLNLYLLKILSYLQYK